MWSRLCESDALSRDFNEVESNRGKHECPTVFVIVLEAIEASSFGEHQPKERPHASVVKLWYLHKDFPLLQESASYLTIQYKFHLYLCKLEYVPLLPIKNLNKLVVAFTNGSDKVYSTKILSITWNNQVTAPGTEVKSIPQMLVLIPLFFSNQILLLSYLFSFYQHVMCSFTILSMINLRITACFLDLSQSNTYYNFYYLNPARTLQLFNSTCLPPIFALALLYIFSISTLSFMRHYSYCFAQKLFLFSHMFIPHSIIHFLLHFPITMLNHFPPA